MKIKKSDFDLSKKPHDLLYNLIKKYYPEYDDDSFNQIDLVTQTFVLIVNMDGQIHNGGVIQFIDNGTGSFFHETIDAAKRIHDDGLADMLTQAAAQFPDGQVPKDWNYRRDLWDELVEKYTIEGEEFLRVDENWGKVWDKLDKWYYDNSDIISQRLIDYLKSNATLID